VNYHETLKSFDLSSALPKHITDSSADEGVWRRESAWQIDHMSCRHVCCQDLFKPQHIALLILRLGRFCYSAGILRGRARPDGCD
jgi:hypothetical protein